MGRKARAFRISYRKMATIGFNLAHIRADTPEILIRESSRMLLLALAAEKLGHDVFVRSVDNVFAQSPHWRYFKHLSDDGRRQADVTVAVAEASEERPPGGKFVGYATTVNMMPRRRELTRYDLFVTTEYHLSHAGHERLLLIPFLVHDVVIGHMAEIGLLDKYAADDLASVRDAYHDRGGLLPRTGKVGFAGSKLYGRAAMAACLPDYCQFVWHEGDQPFTPQMYMSWLSGFDAAVCLPGATPKTNRFAEAVVLGLPVVTVYQQTAVVPGLTSDNAILLNDWSDRESLDDGLARRAKIVKHADVCYRAGWSSMGQVKQMLSRLGVESGS